jgi:hypothetical protein
MLNMQECQNIFYLVTCLYEITSLISLSYLKPIGSTVVFVSHSGDFNSNLITLLLEYSRSLQMQSKSWTFFGSLKKKQGCESSKEKAIFVL